MALPRISSGRSGRGAALAIVSAATFGTSGTFGSSLIDAGWSPAAGVTARIAVSGLVLTAPALVQLRGRWALLRRHAWRVLAYGLIAVAGCQLFYFNAIQRMPVGVALLLGYLAAVLVVGWLWLPHGQRPRLLTIVGGAVSIAGLAMVLNLAGSARLDPIGVMWGLLAATGLAVFFMLSAANDDPLPPIVMAWAGMCTGAAALGILAWTGALTLTASTRDVGFLGHRVSWLVPLLGLSLVAAVISYATAIAAARRLGPKLASFIGMAEVLFSIAFAWILLGQLPAPVQFAGGALIFAGVTLVRLDELRDVPAAASLSGRAERFELPRVTQQEAAVRTRPPGGTWTLEFSWLAASALIVVRRPWSYVIAVSLLAATWPTALLLGDPNDLAGWGALSMTERTAPLFLLVGLAAAIRRLQAARLALVEEAVTRERLRIDGEMRRTLASALESIVASGQRAAAQVGGDSAAVEAELRDLIEYSRATLTEARRMVFSYQQVSLRAELDTAMAVLSTVGIDTRPPGGLSDITDEALQAALRSALADLLRDGTPPRACLIMVTREGSHTRLELRTE